MLWEANQNGPMNLINEMKTVKKGAKVTKLPDTVENKNNEEDIVEKFKKSIRNFTTLKTTSLHWRSSEKF